jgi:hypothetical protein
MPRFFDIEEARHLFTSCHSEASPKGVAEESRSYKERGVRIDSDHAGSIAIAMPRQLIRTIVVVTFGALA